MIKFFRSALQRVSASETLTYSGSAEIAERLERAFENDPRVINVSCNTGYHYTTGESSGNSDECAREGQPEVGFFSMEYKAKYKSEIEDIYQRVTSTQNYD